MEDLVMVDMHEHPMVFTENIDELLEYFRNGNYEWAYQAGEARGLGRRGHCQRIPRRHQAHARFLHGL